MVSRLLGWNRTDAGQERHLFSAPESWRKRLQAIRLWRPLLVTKTGSKLWRYAFNFDSKQKLLALGQYPVTSLADARIKCDDAKKLLAEGIDPSVNRKEERRKARMARANTFDALAKELMDKSEARRTRPGPQSSATVNAPSGSEPAPATFPPLDFFQNPGFRQFRHRIQGLCVQIALQGCNQKIPRIKPWLSVAEDSYSASVEVIHK
jgi:hypothetical protein